MDSHVKSLSRVAVSLKKPVSNGEDAVDRLNYVLTPAILLGIASVIGMKQYVFQPIQCWSVKELDGKRMKYAENYCWVENTFHYDMDNPIPHTDDPGKHTRIYYYQWVPFVLMAQAALFYAPHLLWLLLSSNSGVDMRQLAEQARKVDDAVDDAGRQKRIRFLCNSLLKFVRFRDRYRERGTCRRLVSFFFGKPAFAMYLVFAYLLVKTCYVINCVCQLYLMRSFLGLNMTSFGFKLLTDISANRTWETTNVFPRVTFCNFNTRVVGKPRQYTLQCVLPVNMLNEKFYILIWFWVVITLALNSATLLQTLSMLVLGASRRGVVKRQLRATRDSRAGSNNKDVEEVARRRREEGEFVDKFLRTDGVFILRVIQGSAGDVVASEAAAEAFELWRHQRRLDEGYNEGCEATASTEL